MQFYQTWNINPSSYDWKRYVSVVNSLKEIRETLS
jgi:hypothetical protein